jgi:hypothetical protein
VSEGFEGRTGYGCPGPTPPANDEIQPTRAYWYVQMVPRPATPPPKETPISPTAPPNVPEPFIRQALFLIDSSDGQIVARKLFCVIY